MFFFFFFFFVVVVFFLFFYSFFASLGIHMRMTLTTTFDRTI